MIVLGGNPSARGITIATRCSRAVAGAWKLSQVCMHRGNSQILWFGFDYGQRQRDDQAQCPSVPTRPRTPNSKKAHGTDRSALARGKARRSSQLRRSWVRNATGTSHRSSISVSSLFFAVNFAVKELRVASHAMATPHRRAHSTADRKGNVSMVPADAAVTATDTTP